MPDVFNKKIRKQVYDLTLSDFEEFPIWEFALDEEGEEGQDEATVRPRPDIQFTGGPDEGMLIIKDEGMLVVKTEFISKDGTIFHGYCSVDIILSLGRTQPTIITSENKQVSFWYGIKPNKSQIKKAYHDLKKKKKELFPITYRSLIKIEGIVLQGIIPAYCCIDIKRKDKIIEVQ